MRTHRSGTQELFADAETGIAMVRRHANRRALPQAQSTAALVRQRFTLTGPQEQTLAALEVYVADLGVCAHEQRCCAEHQTHSTPHIGCILR